MKLIKKYKIYWSPQFTNELKKILTFMNCQFNNYSISNNFKNNIINLIQSLDFFPERYPKITNFKYKDRNIRKLVFKKFIIIYEVQIKTR